MPLEKALTESGATRLRPILMTTLTTVLSMNSHGFGLRRQRRPDAGAGLGKCRRLGGIHLAGIASTSGVLHDYLWQEKT